MAGPSDSRPRRLLRLSDVTARASIARSTIYKLIAAGRFPRPVSVSDKTVAWVEQEVDDWIEQRVAARDQRSPSASHASS